MCEMIEKFCSRLGFEDREPWETLLPAAEALRRETEGSLLRHEGIERLQSEWNMFPRYYEDVLRGADAVAADDGLSLYVYGLFISLRDGVPLKCAPPDFRTLATDFAPFFAVLGLVPSMIERSLGQGIPHEIIADTLREFDTQIGDYEDLFGRVGCRIYTGWLMCFVKGNIFRVGRLNFERTTFSTAQVRVFEQDGKLYPMFNGVEVHSDGMLFGSAGQNDGQPLKTAIEEVGGVVYGYVPNALGEFEPKVTALDHATEVLRDGDAVIGVHIPTTGGSLSPEICRKSIENAIKFFEKFYSDQPFDFFVCYSWLLEKRIETVLGHPSNITKFADRFTVWPLRSQGNGIYEYLFHLPSPVPPETLPEDNSLQKAAKAYLMSGRFLYEKAGIFRKNGKDA